MLFLALILAACETNSSKIKNAAPKPVIDSMQTFKSILNADAYCQPLIFIKINDNFIYQLLYFRIPFTVRQLCWVRLPSRIRGNYGYKP